ncbi:MAG: hypothetical protein AAB657_00980 [Patescibacteria group bacterium]
MKKSYISSKFSSLLFWDTNLSSIRKIKHRDFIIKRVLQFGDLKDWKIINDFYTRAQIKRAFIKSRDLDPISQNFWSVFLGVNKKILIKNNFYTKKQF